MSVTIIYDTLYSIFNKPGAMMFSLIIDINNVNRAMKYLYQITTCICSLLFHIEGFVDCLSLQTYIMSTLFLMSSDAILTCFDLC